jgi:hypothetical protein
MADSLISVLILSPWAFKRIGKSEGNLLKLLPGRRQEDFSLLDKFLSHQGVPPLIPMATALNKFGIFGGMPKKERK